MADAALPLKSDVLRSIAKVVGEEAAVGISIRFGGRRLYIPQQPTTESELVLLIGRGAAQRLSKRYGGTWIDVPISAGKRARIIELCQADRTKSDIAEIIGCSERYVYQVVADYRESGGSLAERPRDRSQLGFFDGGGDDE